MLFNHIIPDNDIKEYIEYYWIIENDDPAVHRQKIIPDGYPEIIIHYRDPYRININNKWEVQSRYLVAGQIKKHFYLENTAASGVFGIKLRPPALTHLFDIQMDRLADKVVSIDELNEEKLHTLISRLQAGGKEERTIACNEYFRQLVAASHRPEKLIDEAIDSILACKGVIEINKLCKTLFTTQRQLQRLFKKYIGIPPKIYARIIRFNYIFQLIKHDQLTWTQVALDAGYYDQAHFIRNFKSFTGEDPSRYFFDEKNIANFFLKTTGNRFL